jgi:hypothetical protein
MIDLAFLKHGTHHAYKTSPESGSLADLPISVRRDIQMKMNKIAFAVIAAFLAPAALAVPISGLINTGVGAANNAQDLNYALTVTNGTTVAGAHGYAADQVDFPDGGPWIGGNTGVSKWLTPFQDETQSFDPVKNGVYVWTLTFDLTGFDTSVGYLQGRWAADNFGSVWLNGEQIGVSAGFANWAGFYANNLLFNSGINTLQFVVTNTAQNGGNPTGLRVEFTGSEVPEPESYALLLGSLGVLGAISRRRAK